MIAGVAEGVGLGDAEVRGRSNGILIRAKEEELPLVGIRLFEDPAGWGLGKRFPNHILRSCSPSRWSARLC